MAIQSPTETPFTIIVDTREQAPFGFTDIKDTSGNPLFVYKQVAGLASGDYSLLDMEGQIAIERKSHIDFLGSIGQGRDRFQREIARLNEMEYAAVVIEADWHQLLFDGHPKSQITPMVISRTLTSWSIRYPRVHWWPCLDKRHAELMTFRLLDRFWELKANKEI